MKNLSIGLGAILFSLMLVSCASQRQNAVCSEIRMRLNSMQYSAEQRVFIQEELDSCESTQQALETKESQQYQGIYSQFANDSSQRATDSAATSNPEVTPAHP